MLGPTLGGKTPYGWSQRNGCSNRNQVTSGWYRRGSRNHTAHRCQLCATQLLNGNTTSAPNAYAIAYRFAAIGAPDANMVPNANARGVALANSGLHATIVIRLK